MGNKYGDSSSPSSYSDQECDREVLAVTTPPKSNLTPSTPPQPESSKPAAKKVAKVPHSPYPDFSASEEDDEEDEKTTEVDL